MGAENYEALGEKTRTVEVKEGAEGAKKPAAGKNRKNRTARTARTERTKQDKTKQQETLSSQMDEAPSAVRSPLATKALTADEKTHEEKPEVRPKKAANRKNKGATREDGAYTCEEKAVTREDKAGNRRDRRQKGDRTEVRKGGDEAWQLTVMDEKTREGGGKKGGKGKKVDDENTATDSVSVEKEEEGRRAGNLGTQRGHNLDEDSCDGSGHRGETRRRREELRWESRRPDPACRGHPHSRTPRRRPTRAGTITTTTTSPSTSSSRVSFIFSLARLLSTRNKALT